MNFAILPYTAIKDRQKEKESVSIFLSQNKKSYSSLYAESLHMMYRKEISIEKEEENDLAEAPVINREKGQALLLKLCCSHVIIGTVSCQWVSTHTILIIEQVRFALPVHD